MPKPDLEAAYAEFCNIGKPVTAFLALFALYSILFIIIADSRVRTHNPHALATLYDNLITYGEEIVFLLPALFAAFRGRQFVKEIFFGRLSMLGVVVIGTCVGGVCVLFPNVINLWFGITPEIDLKGLSQTSGGPLISVYLLGPFGEEMLHQVGLQTWLQRFGPIVAVLATTAIFWGGHLYNNVSMHDAFIFFLPGLLCYALIRQLTKSFGAAIIAHSTYNIVVSCFESVVR